MDAIVRLEIQEEGRPTYTAGPPAPTSQVISRHYPMRHQVAGDLEKIGELVVIASLSNVYARLFNRTFIILATQGLKTFLVSLFILYLIYRLVIQHLLKISAYTQKLRLGSLGPELAIDRRNRAAAGEDEIDRLVNAINCMRHQMATDLERRKQVETELRLSEEKYRTLVETIPLGVQLTDRTGRIIFSNPAHHRIQEHQPDELVGKFIWDLIDDPVDKERIRAYYGSMISEQPRPTPYFSKDRTKGGRLIHTQINWDYLRDDRGDVQYILSVINDISEQKQLEAELLQARKTESLGTLTGGIAHDFNNILSVIIGNNELALDDISDEQVVGQCLEEIQRAALRARDIVGQLLSYARKSQPEKRVQRAAPLFEDALKLLRPLIPATIAIKVEIDLGEAHISATPSQLHMAMMNICINAAQAMEETGGTLKVTAQQVNLEAKPVAARPGTVPGNYLQIDIEDDGPGMSTEIIGRIFDPYFTTKEVGKGSGMGLAVVHGIVQNHEGQISVRSKPGRGTHFRLLFPAAQIYRSSETPSSPKKREVPTGKERILFVDDEAGIVTLAKQMLVRLGYRVETCTRPDDALARFNADPQGFDLLITDMAMPAMSGDQLAEAVLEIRPSLPFILSTGYSRKLERGGSDGLRLAHNVIKKPFDMKTLAQVVRQTLDGIIARRQS
jgi:PAS domain S-box-containing protein